MRIEAMLERYTQAFCGVTCESVRCGGAAWPSIHLMMGNGGSHEVLIWCSWRLQSGETLLASSAQHAEVAHVLDRLVGDRVVAFDCRDPAAGAILRFASGLELHIRADPGDPHVPSWSLWTPRGSLRVGPGARLTGESRSTGAPDRYPAPALVDAAPRLDDADLERFAVSGFADSTPAERKALCAELATMIAAKLTTAGLHAAVGNVIAQLRGGGHDLWSYDADDDFEIWGPSYVAGGSTVRPGLVITFRLDDVSVHLAGDTSTRDGDTEAR